MRRYYRHRQARPPRLWVACLPMSPVAATLAFIIQPPLIVNLVVCFVLGFIASNIQWAIWRRRHPIVTPEEWMTLQREAAPWN